jgi:ribose transport system substrate-binding protein
MTRRMAGGLSALCVALCGPGCGGTAPEAGSLVTTGGATGPSGAGVYFVGFDASPPLVDALRAGKIQGLVLQDPYRMGELGVRTLVDHLEGKAIDPVVSTGETMVTPENMNDAEVAVLLDPPREEHGSDASIRGPKAKTWRVMVIPKGTTHEFWKTIHAGARKAATDLGSVEIIWQGPLKEDDRTKQIDLVETAVAVGVDGIVLAPLDARALVDPVERAIAKGISVVIIDSALESDRPAGYVATDNYRGGVLAAQRLGGLMKGAGRAILLRYAAGSASTEQREQGFLDTMQKEFPGITLVSRDQYAGATAAKAQEVAQNLVTRFRGQVDGVFCPNESSTNGMLRALEGAGMLRTRP